MALVVVGGHSRNIGKTSVVAGIIAAIPEAQWTAAKLTQFGHGICSVTTEPCDCALTESEHAWSLDEERDRSGQTDTSRFLVAGAVRSLWVRTKQGMLAEAMPTLRRELAGARNVILESNSVLRFLRPDLYLSVLDFANPDFKDSAREFLDRADAILIHSYSATATPQWDRVSLRLIEGKPTFRISTERFVPPELVAFIRSRLGKSAEKSA